MQKPHNGFTLLELLVVMVVVAILAAVAIPSYTDYIRKSRRTEATSALLRVANGMEKFLLANNTYPTAITELVNGSGGTLTGVGSMGLISSGPDWTTTSGNYAVSIVADADGPQSMRATPRIGTPQADDSECALLSLSMTGNRTSLDSSNADTTDVCWRD